MSLTRMLPRAALDLKRALLTVLVAGLALGCSDAGPMSPASDASSPQLAAGGDCRSVQGVWYESGDPNTGYFQGVITGGLEGTSESWAGLAPPYATGVTLHGAGVHKVYLNSGETLDLTSKFVVANGRLNAKFTVQEGARGNLTGHATFGPEMAIEYHGQVCGV